MEKIELTRSRKLAKAKKKKLERLYDKKPLLELIVALLSIPSLILLVILNFNSLKSLTSAKPTPTPVSAMVIPSGFYAAPVSRRPKPTQSSLLSQTPCIKGLGSITITSPNENDIVATNPVEIDISYDDSKYCEAVWSYRVNGGQWSDYNNNSVVLYNLPDGEISFDLRVKSITNSDTTSLTRHFTYTGQSILPTTASSSAN